MGLVSLFADWLYEGARAALPQYMYQLGASAVVVGAIFGVGDALGYALRLFTGPLSDRRGGYWGETFAGYALQVLAIVGLAAAPWLPAVAGLVMLERTSKALRTPARDAILSAAGGNRQSAAFGLHASIDQIGAVLGSATALALLALGLSYRLLFLSLAAPGLAALATLYFAYRAYGIRPRRLGRGWRGVDRPLALFAISQFFLGASLMHISLEMYREGPTPWLGSLIYLAAMAAEIPLSLAWGKAYEASRTSLYLGPAAAFAASALFSLQSTALGLAGAVIYSAATSYVDVAAKARAAELSADKATAIGLAGSAYGLGLALGGPLYGLLLGLGLYGVIPLASLALALASTAAMAKSS
nr:MAG: MFS transporter [Thermoproteus sp. AZ2]